MRNNDNIAGQISIFDLFQPKQTEEPIVAARKSKKSYRQDWEPRIGNFVYQVRLDTVRKMVVEQIFITGSGEKRFSAQEIYPNGSKGLHDTASMSELGHTFFWKRDDAMAKAEHNRHCVDKITAAQLQAETVAWAAYCCVKGYSGIQTAEKKFKMICLTNCGIYVQEQMCYPFLYRFPDMDTASEQFRKMLRETERVKKEYIPIRIPIPYEYRDVYRCDDMQYSVLEYTLNHGAKWQACCT